jgi:CBS domain-containing protein
MEKMKVGEIYQLHDTASAQISREASLEDVIHRFATEPGIRGIFLVDEERRFAGMVSRTAIIKWAEFQLFGRWQGGLRSSDINELAGTLKARYLATGDAKSVGVRAGDSLGQAFDQMMRLGEDIIPVLDDGGRIIGDLMLSEVLLKAIEVGKQGN